MALDRFSAPVREWFDTSFPAPTDAQIQGWPAIAEGDHTLILAPTGSGKTLAAFLWAIDRLMTEPEPHPKQRTRVLYISPLRALAVDVEKNLRAPLRGISLAAERLGEQVVEPEVAIRSGDTPSDERRRMIRNPPDILITTPESLYLYLTSRGRETLTGVRWVIVDEIHSVAGTKRGAHLALSLERLEELVVGSAGDDTPARPQRIGLSATQRPLEEIARFLGGFHAPGEQRPVTIVDAGVSKELDLEIVVPVEDMAELGSVIEEPVSGPAAAGPSRRSIWPAVHPRLLDLILEHRSTLVFVNSRRLAERLAARLNELHHDRLVAEGSREPEDPIPELVKAHHGSLARERRTVIEDELKRGELRGLIATSSLELGIDMGAIDLVVQVESPGSVARGLQRIGRAGHQVGEPSRGKLFPKYRGDLLEAAVVVGRMHAGAIEETRYPRNPVDVLAQQIVAMAAMDEWSLDDLSALVRRAANFSDLSDQALHAVLDLLAGRYPSEEFSELHPRIVWDRVGGTIRGRTSAQRLAVTNPGTIPDRGLYGVFLPDGARVGELDEEMVYESRSGETFTLGASTWRIEEITRDRVVVTPAPGEPGKMPFWHGDKPGRPLELGRALGAFVREVREHTIADGAPAAAARLRERSGLDAWAADNLVAYLQEQTEATGALPDDRTVVIERFRDEIGDWRVCLLSPLGAQVHAPWSLAIEQHLRDRHGLEVETMWSDDGIVLRLPEAVDRIPTDELLIDPDEVESLVVDSLPGSALFASRFREAAARALLLPRRRPGKRTPLWQQRQRSADLLSVAAKYPSFPILLETTRECLRDVFDVPGLQRVLRDLRSRSVRMVTVDTEHASPFAQSLLFGWIANYMYEGDAPLAERRAAALALDRDLLSDLLGADELRELIDADALAELELELQHLVGGRRARDPDELHDLLRTLGTMTTEELAARSEDDPMPWIEQLVSGRRAIRVRVAGEERLAAAQDAARLRDGLGVSLPGGLPAAFTEPVDGPLDQLVARYARTHGPFLTAEPAARLGAPVERIRDALLRLEAAERLVRGEFRPEGTEREWCDVDVLRRLRRRSLAVLRKEIEPVDGATLGRFLPRWHGIGERRRGAEALVDALSQLQGAPIPASVLESDVLPARVADHRSSDLDALLAAGELVWVGAGSLGASDGRIVLLFRDEASVLAPTPPDDPPDGSIHGAIRDHLATNGASFWPDLVQAAGTADEGELLPALWDLVWAGEVTNDTLAPLRAYLAGTPRRRSRGGRPRPGRLTRLGPPAGAGRWSLVSSLLDERTPTAVSHARSEQLLERMGIVTREAVLAEGVPGGFAGVYQVLKAMEEAGRVRRGYFVAGLGAAQFAVPGAVDRLRALRDPDREGPEVVTLAATDPAQPYGAALSWPDSEGRPARQAGAYLVLVDGEATVYLERGARSLATFAPAADTAAWVDALTALVKDGRIRRIELERIDGEDAHGSPFVPLLEDAGFVDTYRGLTFHG
ncbi:MAG: DEAD/DEAH box helicase [Actinobacteria bacterium]|nr:DEAD/DEAH box helicase [Actinomycetota bacterium]